MKKLVVLGAGVLGAGSVFAAAAASAVLFGAGTASAAPDVVGDKYSDAQETIKEGGGSAVVASRFGGKLDEGDCIVTNAWNASFLRVGEDDGGQVNVALNCDGAYATAKNPGTSVQNSLGRAAKSEAEEQAENEKESELAAPVTPDE